MAADGDRIPPLVPNDGPRGNAPQPQQLSVPTLQRAAEFLSENSKIHIFRAHYNKYRRYVNLETREVFDSLVEIYANLFKSQFHRYKRIYDSLMTAVTGTSGWTALARVYISVWLLDVYVSNREAVKKLSVPAFNEHFRHEFVQCSTEYDEFLTLLHASLKPTHITSAPEDALYIPLLAQTPAWTTTNPFNITNFNFNLDVFYAITQMMKSDNVWKLSPLSTNVLGRPCWLFDWHDQDNVCAWFPMEGNYNEQDITLAYIIGVACTPKLGSRDVDDWVSYPNAVVPPTLSISTHPRVTPRRFYGSYEVRTVEVQKEYNQDVFIPNADLSDEAKKQQSKKRKQLTITDGSIPATAADSQSSSSMYYAVLAPRYQISDWTYYQQVFISVCQHTKSAAHRIICMK